MTQESPTAEHARLADSAARRADWKKWGPYVSERSWGTVREDYSEAGDAWEYFPHDHARSRAYRWNEDGLAGFCNRFQNVCLAVALWNERDTILKERLFGLSNVQGNHGEDVKEYYFYLDGTPTHSYMKMLYKYPQVAFPYDRLVEESRLRGRDDPELELIDTLPEVFVDNRYFDVLIEYAKSDEEDLLCRIRATNRGPQTATLHLLPHLWYRNAWSWGYRRSRPELVATDGPHGVAAVRTDHRHVGPRWWYVDAPGHAIPELLFTENETNTERLFGQPLAGRYVKDGIHAAVVDGERDRINPEARGSKVAAHIKASLAPNGSIEARIRFSNADQMRPFENFAEIFDRRLAEADAFYDHIQPPGLGDDERRVQRQALAGLMWSKQFYHYGVDLWLDGDPTDSRPPASRKRGRNAEWRHFYALDVLSMPDKWEYPWFAAWDLAFHTLPIALIDPEWAKRQLVLLLREWYTHPSGQLPAYEWAFGDVNPPVHAWAAWRVYQIDRDLTGTGDTLFLERVFQKLLLNFTWWVNRKDRGGNNIFSGGFLGLDNIGIFDRSAPLPVGGHLEQADGTAWMGMYCLNMLAIALELGRTRPAYEDMATKFFEHFVAIANAIHTAFEGRGLWDDGDGFFYDLIHTPGGRLVPLRLRSFVGLIPLLAVETLDPDVLEQMPRFRRRMEWFIEFRPHLLARIASLTEAGRQGRRLLSLVDEQQLGRVLQRVLDEGQFLSPHGVRSLSREHHSAPVSMRVAERQYTVSYEPADSSSEMFGGNSNWRGPIWMPLNFLLIEALQKYHRYYGEDFKAELPLGSGHAVDLQTVADDLSRRLIRLFLRDDAGRRPFRGNRAYFDSDPHWRDHLLFHEYFNGDTGAGLGASHQTGWTALVATLIQQSHGPGSGGNG